jgi:outer membrane cobalamin receptor
MKNKSKNSEPDNSRRGPDAIGGTVNLVTKTGGELPTLSLYGAGGFTPIINTVPVAE